jgi:hypothetical protein
MGLKFHFTPRYSNDGIKYVPLVEVVFSNDQTMIRTASAFSAALIQGQMKLSCLLRQELSWASRLKKGSR